MFAQGTVKLIFHEVAVWIEDGSRQITAAEELQSDYQVRKKSELRVNLWVFK